VDGETEKWPLPSDFRGDLDDIKYEYCAVPLRVYRGDDFVEIVKVNDALRGGCALVELHFELPHLCMRQKNQDLFNASIEQVLVDQPSYARPSSVYKRKNVRDGLILLNPTLAL